MPTFFLQSSALVFKNVSTAREGNTVSWPFESQARARDWPRGFNRYKVPPLYG